MFDQTAWRLKRQRFKKFPMKKVALIILDGWGHGKADSSNAIFKAKTPFIDNLYKKYPNAELQTSGEAVGLPTGQMGNSEVGHMNIGAGRVVFQELLRINNAIKNQELEKIKVLKEAITYARENNKSIHLLGLLSDGGVHSHINHLIEIINIIDEKIQNKTFVHAFMDGRDTDPNGGIDYVKKLQEKTKHSSAKLASIIGRYYAMDRDKRWEKTKLAYDLLVNGKGEKFQNPVEALKNSYQNNVTDEFIKPIVLTDENQEPIAKIQEGDVVLFFNFRTDRGRQLTQVLTQENFPDFEMKTMPLKFITMTPYDETYKGIEVLFGKENIEKTLGEILEKNKKKQVRAAETEKYPHVTFFFSGGRETPFENEKRIMANSPKVATYDLQPEMSAIELTEKVLIELENKQPDFLCLNFANPDMVGHTGVFEAVVKAVETVDNCTKKITEKALELNYDLLITADHGNADFLINEDGSPNTAHTTNLVPLFWVSNDQNEKINSGKLGDLAPTILKLMNLEIPEEMTGNVLI